MAKPIFIAFIPVHSLPTEEIETYISDIAKQSDMPDYHCLWVPVHSLDYPTFKVFYEKDFDLVKYEELQQIVKDSINNMLDERKFEIKN